VKTIEFFNCGNVEEQQRFVTKIALNLGLEAYAPKENIFGPGDRADKLYIVQRGLIGCRGRVLSAGRTFGEDMILHDSRRTYEVFVLVFVNVYFLSQEKLRYILDSSQFAHTERTIRAAAIRMCFRNELKQITTLRKLSPGYEAMTKEELEYWKDYYRAIAREEIQPLQMHEHPKHIRTNTLPFKVEQYHHLKARMRASGNSGMTITELFDEEGFEAMGFNDQRVYGKGSKDNGAHSPVSMIKPAESEGMLSSQTWPRSSEGIPEVLYHTYPPRFCHQTTRTFRARDVECFLSLVFRYDS
jgi:hypothetical protein